MIFDFTLVITLGFIGGLLAKALSQPTVVGYLLAGIAGSFIFGGSFQNKEVITAISQIGVALLLFTLGMELSFTRFKGVIKIAVIGGILQIVLSILVYRLILLLFSFTSLEALIIAAAFSLSSTAVVVKILHEKGMTETLAGEIMVAWLLIQDLAVVPILIMLPIIGKGLDSQSLTLLVPAFLKIGILLAFYVFIGRKAVAVFIAKIALFNNKELLILASLSLCLLSAFLTELIGLSFVLGAFLAGVLIAETTENHLAFAEIRPLRDVFAVIFFVSLVLVVPREYLLANIPQALLLSVIVIAVKFVLVGVIGLYFGYHSKVSFTVAVGLVQVGEFAFVLANESLHNRLISSSAYAQIISVAILTIIMTPFLFNVAPALYRFLRSFIKKTIPTFYVYLFQRFDHEPLMEELPYRNHVVICGFGRMGKYIGRALESCKIPYVVVEINRALVTTLRLDGIAAVYGDPADIGILDYAQVDLARLIIIAVPDVHTQTLIITNAKTLNPSIKIISRTHFEEYQKLLRTLGADAVVQPEFEAALTVVSKTLSLYGFPKEAIGSSISSLKISHGLA